VCEVETLGTDEGAHTSVSLGVNGARGGDVRGKGSGLGDVTATAGSDFLLPAVSAQSLGVLALRTAVTEGEESWKTLEGAGGFLAFDLVNVGDGGLVDFGTVVPFLG